MITVLKLTIANMKQKKFRSLLIILSIVLSVSLMYTVLSMSSSTKRIFEHKVKKEFGNAEFMLLPDDTSGKQYISKLDFNEVDQLEYALPLVSAYGYSKIDDTMVPIDFTGITAVDYETIYGLQFVEQSTEVLQGRNVWIGEETASEYDLKLGDELTVTIAGKDYRFVISGVIEDKNNNLGYDLGKLELVTDQKVLSEILGINNEVSAYFTKRLSGTEKESFFTDLEAAFPEYKINDVTNLEFIKQMLSMITTSLFLMVSAVIMVSAFIIYSSFKIITIERMPLMGTLRSIGATRKMTVRILLFEGLFCGIMGALLGNGLGIVILTFCMKMMLKNFGISPENISYFNLNYILIAAAIGLILAVGSALIPILKTSKRSIRSIIFAELKNEKHFSIMKTIIGFLLIIIGYVLFQLAPVELELPMNITGMAFVTIGGAFIIPILSRLLAFLLSLILRPLYRETLDITMLNMKNDRTVMNNIMLLAMGLGVILMINNFSTTVGSAVSDLYSTGKMDAVIFSNLDYDFVDKVKEVDGIEHVYTTKSIQNIKANDGSINLMYLEGMDGGGYSEYAWNEFGEYLTEDLLKEFKSKRTAIITRFTSKKYELSKGDILTMEIDGKSIDYEILAIVPSIMNNGNMTFVQEDFLAEDAGIENIQSMYINFKEGINEKDVIQEIKELMPYDILPIQTLEEMREQNMKSNNGIFFLMKAISVIAMFIGIVGILNNFTISFLSRKKLISTMRSLGLSKKKTLHNMLFEAFLCGCLGTLSGLMLGTVLLNAMCFVVEAMGIPSEVMFYSAKDYLFVLISGIVLSMLSAILPAISITKENIVAGLRYE